MKENKATILVVDDEPANVRLLERYLLPEGYQVITAFSGEDALKKIAEKEIDSVLLDVIMPGMNGFRVTKRIREDEKTRLLPVVLITGLTETEDRIKGIEAGCDDFISKPFDQTEVLSRVKMLLKMNFYRAQLNEKEKFEHILNRMEEGIIVLDHNLQILRLNTPAANLLYLDFLDQPMDFVTHLKKHFQVDYTGNLSLDLRKQAISFDIEREETDTAKTLILGINSSIIREPSGEISNIVLTLRNVTDLRKEEWLKRDFFGLISHKLRTPLTEIYVSADMLQDKIGESLNEEENKFFNIILAKTVVLKDLFNKLLQFTMMNSRTLDLPKEQIELSSYLPQLIETILKSLKDKKVDLQTELTNKESKITMNRTYFDLIIGNLIENAIKFNDKEMAKISVLVRRIDDKIEISVADNGPGVPPEEKNKIFEKFYQVDKYFTGNIEGVGLGLALVKQLVEAHKGEIKVESQIGKGAEFTIMLPAFITDKFLKN